MKNIIFNTIKKTLLFVSAIIFGVWVFGPLEPAKIDVGFDSNVLGENLNSYLMVQEKKFSDITIGVQKRIIWADKVGEKTPLSIIYIHGFSATSEEIRPVPDQIASTLKANLYYTRLTGHGRSPMAMAEPNVADWMSDMAEAIAIGRKIGQRIIVISTSTGSTLSAAAALNPILSRDISGFIFISPNFGINNPFAKLLTWPAARWWVPLIAGKMRHSTPRNKQHSKFWTTTYPTIAAIPMAAIVKAVTEQDFSKVTIPALFYFSLEDKVVDPEATKNMTRKWGGRKKIINVTMTEQDDKYSHIVTGNIVSPNQTDYTVRETIKWISSLLNNSNNNSN
jgi:pimeloyl-ACP methyl ester carboxylesterase